MQVTSIFMMRIICNAVLHALRLMGLCEPVHTTLDARFQLWMRRRVVQLLTALRRGGLWLAMMTCAGGACSQLKAAGDTLALTQGTPQPHCTWRPAHCRKRGRCRYPARPCRTTLMPCAASWQR